MLGSISLETGNSNHIMYPPLDGNGWKQTDQNTLAVDWNSEDNIAWVRTTVALIKKGCGCKTSCLTSCCKCKKTGNYCGPGCKWTRCCNLLVSVSPDIVNIEVDEIEDCDNASDGSDDDLDDLEQEVDEIMTNIFGDCDDCDDCEGDSNIASDDGMNPELDS